MNKELNMLREKNPALRICSVLDPEFAPYGRVLEGETGALAAALERTAIPESGNCYEASVKELEEVPLTRELGRTVYGGMPVQAGFCNGRGFTLNAMEYHKCSEVNYTTTGVVLLLALPGQLHDGILQSEDVVGFFLPKDVLVEIHPLVLHFAPCRVAESGFRCLVILEKGTNEDLPQVNTAAPGEEKLLWMRNKWLTCHPDSPQAQQGAFQGIRGENLILKI